MDGQNHEGGIPNLAVTSLLTSIISSPCPSNILSSLSLRFPVPPDLSICTNLSTVLLSYLGSSSAASSSPSSPSSSVSCPPPKSTPSPSLRSTNGRSIARSTPAP